MEYFFIFALLSPIFYALLNVVDKYIISKHVKHILGYSVISGLLIAIFGFGLALFLDWSGVTLKSIIFPIITGLLSAVTIYLYYYVISKADVSSVIGLNYLYPLIVFLLSFIFLSEKITLLGYFAALLMVTGAVLISLRFNKLEHRSLLMLMLLLAFVGGVCEFLIKIGTNNLAALNAVAIHQITAGLVVSLGLFKGKIREGFFSELKNIRFALLSEIITFFAVLTIFLAMSGLKATIVSAVAAIQPMAVLFFESIAHRLFGGIINETSWVQKTIAITLIVVGVVLLSLSEGLI